MKSLKVIISIIIIVTIAGSVLHYFNSPPRLMRSEVIRIESGDSVRSAARKLKSNNLIENERFFTAIASILKLSGIKQGKYRIEEGTTSHQILLKFVRGDIMKARVTFPEGFNIYQIAERLDKRGVTAKDDFLHYCSNSPFLRSIGILAPTAEGYLFPDTYIFAEESESRDIIEAMHNRLKLVLGQMDLSTMNALRLDKHGLLTMASLIEKEARIATERPYVSSVFHNRLKKNMKLDCDPTVRYAVKRFTGPIYLGDLRSTSPYNTYIHRGLPPTPICSPGKAAITAALNPADTEYYFFVSRNDGSHLFSKTYAEHNRAVQRYQRGGK